MSEITLKIIVNQSLIMSCDNCEHHDVKTFYRWKNANIEMRGCREHLRQVMDALNEYQSGDQDGEGDEGPSLVDRHPDVPAPGVWYWYGEWSVVNFGKLMKHAEGVDGSKFTQWEAMRGDSIVRAGSWEGLKDEIDSLEEAQ